MSDIKPPLNAHTYTLKGQEYNVSTLGSDSKDDSLNALSVQVDGSHYKLPIQPIEFIYKNKLDFIEGNIVKYICRNKKDEDQIKKWKKIEHYAQLKLQFLLDK